MRHRFLALPVFLLAAPPAHACAVDMAGFNFGALGNAHQTFLSSEVRVECPVSATFQLALSPGSVGFGNNHLARRMPGPGGAHLNYNIHKDPARTQVWGSEAFNYGTRITGNATANVPQSITVYGIVYATPGAPPGQYGESLTVTVTFP